MEGSPRRLDEPKQAYLVDRFQTPQPRVNLGQQLAGLATAAVDISDGLVADLGHVAARRRCPPRLNARPNAVVGSGRAPGNRRSTIARALLTGGDDYELVFTAPAEASAQSAANRREQ